MKALALRGVRERAIQLLLCIVLAFSVFGITSIAAQPKTAEAYTVWTKGSVAWSYGWSNMYEDVIRLHRTSTATPDGALSRSPWTNRGYWSSSSIFGPFNKFYYYFDYSS